jgi:asparagine synthase (glutamine-hydrolysing)
MCGIVGIMGSRKSPAHLAELQDMTQAIFHRGPDEDGFYLGAETGMGMRRLSIIDLKTGRQPISNEDGTVWVVFNGEIYNFQELRDELEHQGHRFSTTTDTETIVHLYEEYGESCVDKMRGMFAFAVWDDRKKILLLARDRLGIKPLFYGEVNGRLVFASELKAILQVADVERRLNWSVLNHLFATLNTTASESIIEGIHKLEPAHVLIASPGKPVAIRPYWDVTFTPDYKRTERETIEQLREVIRESVRLHMVSDVPVGAFLSGGLDSSAVVATMAAMATDRVNTFSIGFSEAEYNELGYARTVAQRLGTKHHEMMLEPNALDIIEELAWYLDEPLGDSSAIPTYMVSKLAAQHLKVVLSGDGGDELFAGYDKYVVERRERKYDMIPTPVRKVFATVGNNLPEGAKGRNFLRHFGLSGWERYADAGTLFRVDEKRKLFQDETFQAISEYEKWRRADARDSAVHSDWLSTMQYRDIKGYLPLDILVKVDRMSMAHSLESRVPLLDHKVVEFAATIPPHLKLNGDIRKYIFKEAMRGILPSEIIDRPKRGFAIPLGKWFRGKLHDFVGDLLLSERTRQRGIFRPSYIEQLLRLNRNGRDLDLQLWTLISFELWCRTFLDRAPRRSAERMHGVLLNRAHPALTGNVAVQSS